MKGLSFYSVFICRVPQAQIADSDWRRFFSETLTLRCTRVAIVPGISPTWWRSRKRSAGGDGRNRNRRKMCSSDIMSNRRTSYATRDEALPNRKETSMKCWANANTCRHNAEPAVLICVLTGAMSDCAQCASYCCSWGVVGD